MQQSSLRIGSPTDDVVGVVLPGTSDGDLAVSSPALQHAMKHETWIIVPVHNEEQVLGAVLSELVREFPNVVVVDDGSTDRSWSEILKHAPHALRHAVNRGQGAALQTGMDYALRQGAGVVAHFDADGQHRVEDLKRLVHTVASGTCDVALGDRFGGDTSQLPKGRRVLLRLAVAFHRMVSGAAVNDVHNGLRVFSRRAAERIRITADRMAHASELLDRIAASGLPYREVPVTIRYSEYSMSKGQSWTGGFRILFHYMVARAFG